MKLDQFFTPDATADFLLEIASDVDPACCVDSACGGGALLRAAEKRFGEIECVGIDKDASAIRKLRRHHAHWLLSNADMLDAGTHRRAHAFCSDVVCDLLVLNPPFSMKSAKGLVGEYFGNKLRTSVAMAHILKSLETFKPEDGAVAIVPESLMHAELDEAARQLISKSYGIEEIEKLQRDTFRGAHANALIVKISLANKEASKAEDPTKPVFDQHFSLIRGGLPCHQARRRRGGIPFVHSTNLAAISRDGRIVSDKKVSAIQRGVVSGCLVLLPRVGIPGGYKLRAVYERSSVQLSDCVIALKLRNMVEANEAADYINREWDSFSSLYKGTGARYLTVNRLTNWLGIGA